MQISGYVLEEKIELLKKDLKNGKKELEAILKKYPQDTEVLELAARLEKAGKEERARIIDELGNIAYLRKKESSEGGASLPFSDYRGKKENSSTR